MSVWQVKLPVTGQWIDASPALAVLALQHNDHMTERARLVDEENPTTTSPGTNR